MNHELWRQEPPPCPADLPDLLAALTAIGAPTGREKKRVDFIRQWLEKETGRGGERDQLDNLVFDLSDGAENVFLLDAHTDTVFPAEQVTIVRNGNRWSAAGVYDNTLACVQLMLLLRHLAQMKEKIPFMVSFTVGEEGTGDLCGIREILNRHAARIAEVCAFDMGLNSITTRAVGSVRWKIRFSAPGGHSWSAFGSPSAIHAAAEWMTLLAQRFPWEKNKYSYNIGVIKGGTGVNAIAEQAELQLDLRSVNPDELNRRTAIIEKELTAFAAAAGVEAHAEKIGFRPAGRVPPRAKVVAALRRAIESLGLQVVESAGSNNCNAVLARGIPAACTGLGSGGNSHTQEEYLDMPSAAVGWRKLWLIVSALAQAV